MTKIYQVEKINVKRQLVAFNSTPRYSQTKNIESYSARVIATLPTAVRIAATFHVGVLNGGGAVCGFAESKEAKNLLLLIHFCRFDKVKK